MRASAAGRLRIGAMRGLSTQPGMINRLFFKVNGVRAVDVTLMMLQVPNEINPREQYEISHTI